MNWPGLNFIFFDNFIFNSNISFVSVFDSLISHLSFQIQNWFAILVIVDINIMAHNTIRYVLTAGFELILLHAQNQCIRVKYMATYVNM
jgi:hypothetical protein